MDPIDLSGLSLADPSQSKSNNGAAGDFGGVSPLSPKLREKMNKLAKWRIDPSLIEFPEGTTELEGGHAKVSRALLTPAFATEADLNEPNNVEDVLKSRDGTFKKAVAVKKLKIEDGSSLERALELALREADFLAGLSHRHIIKLEGFVEDLPNHKVWLIFLWEEHGNLKEFVASQDWEIPERISLIDDVTSGVKYLHSRSPPIYHGDLKSINVLVNSRYRAVITDFGSARRLTKKDVDPQKMRTEEKEAKPALKFHATFCATNNTMTFTGNEYTLRWAAPELLMDDGCSTSSDIWALGWIFYEPMVIPVPQPDSDHAISRTRSPELLMKLGDMYLDQNDCVNAIKLYTETLNICKETSDIKGMASAFHGLGHAYWDQSEYSKAATSYSKALEISTNIGDQLGRCAALWGLAKTHKDQDNYDKAITLYSEVIQISIDIDNQEQRADALRGLAGVYRVQGNYSQAVSLVSEAMEIHTRMGNMFGRASVLWQLGEIHRLQTEYSEAAALFSDSLQICIDIGDRFGTANALLCLADVHRDQNQHGEAVRLYEQAAKIFKQIGSTEQVATASRRAARSRSRLEAAGAE